MRWATKVRVQSLSEAFLGLSYMTFSHKKESNNIIKSNWTFLRLIITICDHLSFVRPQNKDTQKQCFVLVEVTKKFDHHESNGFVK